MPITLGSLEIDAEHTDVREKWEEIGGRNERRVIISGLIVGEFGLDAIESRLDEILDAASARHFEELSIRSGRGLWVRRIAYARELSRESLVGSFTLELETRDAFEESVAESIVQWSVTASGATITVASGGNVDAAAIIEIEAVGDMVNPSISDGARTISYAGVVAAGQTLIFHAVNGTVTLDGQDVTPYAAGDFPFIPPEGATLTYQDDPSSSHTAEITIRFRDRWW